MASATAVIDADQMIAMSATQGDYCYRLDLKQTWRLTGVDPDEPCPLGGKSS